VVREKPDQRIHGGEVRAVDQLTPFAPALQQPGTLQCLQVKGE
jgi:hypothetical protein